MSISVWSSPNLLLLERKDNFLKVAVPIRRPPTKMMLVNGVPIEAAVKQIDFRPPSPW